MAEHKNYRIKHTWDWTIGSDSLSNASSYKVSEKSLLWGFWFFVCAMPLIFSTMAAVATHGILAPLPIVIFYLWAFELPRLSRRHVLFGVEKTWWSYKPFEIGQDYLALSKEDKALFPSNMIELMRSKEMSWTDRENFFKSVSKTFDLLKSRNKARNVLEKREIDISDALAHMSHSREGLNSDISVYQEFM